MQRRNLSISKFLLGGSILSSYTLFLCTWTTWKKVTPRCSTSPNNRWSHEEYLGSNKQNILRTIHPRIAEWLTREMMTLGMIPRKCWKQTAWQTSKFPHGYSVHIFVWLDTEQDDARVEWVSEYLITCIIWSASCLDRWRICQGEFHWQALRSQSQPLLENVQKIFNSICFSKHFIIMQLYKTMQIPKNCEFNFLLDDSRYRITTSFSWCRMNQGKTYRIQTR